MNRFLTALLALTTAWPVAELPRQAAQAQIVIARPSEGETLYAGPSSLIYSLDVTGWVLGIDDPGAVDLSLEVVHDSVVVGRLGGRPATDGSFSFWITVNPGGSSPDFTAPQVEAGCERCHFRSALDLPSGELVLRVSAVIPDGQQMSQERRVTVDRSGTAVVPVRVVRADERGEAVEGVVVEASTRLYEWRARLASATTDATGLATLKVEALAQAPTRYIFKIMPSVHEGILYEGVTPVELVIPPGARSAPALILEVRPRSGFISGQVLNPEKQPLKSVLVWAMHEPDLKCYQATTSNAGGFAFRKLPVGSYTVAIDPANLTDAGITGEPKEIDLTRSPYVRVSLSTTRVPGPIIEGVVLDERGLPLPFTQVNVGEAGEARQTSPSSRTWWAALPALPTTIVVNAPGYYSRSVDVVEEDLVDSLSLRITLARRPETAALEWGAGEIMLSPESRYKLTGRVIELQSGWIWGSGAGEPITIRLPSSVVDVEEGSFAIELNSTSDGWLYVYEGVAYAHTKDGATSEVVHAGEVVRIGVEGPTSPVPSCPILDAAQAEDSLPPLRQVWEPDEAQIRLDRLRDLGVSAAMLITFITYSVGLLLLVLLPISVVSFIRRRR